MTIATRAPVIMPSMATPNRISNQLTMRPAVEVTNAESPWPSTVAMPQLNESKTDSNVHGFSTSVISTAATSTTTTMPWASVRKKRRSSWPADPPDVPCDPTDDRRDEDALGRPVDGASRAMMPEPRPRLSRILGPSPVDHRRRRA